MAQNIKRKAWKSSSTSSTEENLSLDDKRIKHNVSFTDSKPSSESNEVHFAEHGGGVNAKTRPSVRKATKIKRSHSISGGESKKPSG